MKWLFIALLLLVATNAEAQVLGSPNTYTTLGINTAAPTYGRLSVVDSLPTTFTVYGATAFFATKPGVTSQSVMQMTSNYAGQFNFDAVAGIVGVTPAGSTLVNINGIAGYVVNDAATCGTTCNSVGVFSAAVGAVNASHTWNFNGVCIDNTSYATGSGTTRTCSGIELDNNVMSTGSTFNGLTCNGASLAIPASSVCIGINPIGTGIPWGWGMYTYDGSTTNAIDIGTSATGNGVGSQIINLRSRTAGGVNATSQIATDPNNLFTITVGTTAALLIGPQGSPTTYLRNTVLQIQSIAGGATYATFNTGPAATINGTLTLPNITTGTNADVVCVDAGLVLRIQAAASCTISSRRFKRDIEPIPAADSLVLVMALRPRQFFMKDGEHNPDRNAARLQIGLIAEDVAALDPRLAIYEPDMTTPKSWRLEGMIAVMAGAIQEQQHEIENLQKR